MSSQVGGFVALPLALPSQKVLRDLPRAVHYMYIAPHEPKILSNDASRSLLAANVPIDSNEKNLRSLFASQLGGARIEHVDFDPEDVIGAATTSRPRADATQVNVEKRGKKRKRRDDDTVLDDEQMQLPRVDRNIQLVRSGSNAVLVFVDEASQQSALKAVKRAASSRTSEGRAMIQWDNGGMLTGLDRYNAIHRATYPPAEDVLASVTSYLTAHQHIEDQRMKAQARVGAVPDADGFVTVTRGTRATPAKSEAARRALEKEKTKAEKRIGDNFYRFQLREKAKEKERELRRQFQDDVKKVERLKAQRRGETAK